MDDYLIGIRLALDNGVSAGLANIRADLIALDQAVSASAAGLQSLSSPTSLAPMQLHPIPPVEKSLPEPSAGLEIASSPEPIGAVSPNIVERLERPRIWIDPPISAPNASAAVSAPPAAQRSPLNSFHAESSPVHQGSLLGEMSISKAPSSSLVQFLPLAPTTSSVPISGKVVSPSSDATPNAAQSETHVRQSFAPQTPPPAAGSQGGDVYLDGERLGHWVTSHLAREANRPSFGPAGFDPSLSITWPGASQGGL